MTGSTTREIRPICRIYGAVLVVVELLLLGYIYRGGAKFSLLVLLFCALPALGGVLVAARQPIGRVVFLTSVLPQTLLSGLAIVFSGLGLLASWLGGNSQAALSSILMAAAGAALVLYLFAGVVLYAGRFWVD